jgi:hypothetical protein
MGARTVPATTPLHPELLRRDRLEGLIHEYEFAADPAA